MLCFFVQIRDELESESMPFRSQSKPSGKGCRQCSDYNLFWRWEKGEERKTGRVAGYYFAY